MTTYTRGDILIYTNNGLKRLDKLNQIDDLILDTNGEYQKIVNYIKNNVHNKKIYKLKLFNIIDNVFINNNIYSIQNIPYELKNIEIPNYLETKKIKPSMVYIKNLTDFDFVACPILKFNENDDTDNNEDFYRFLGILLIHYNNESISLNEEENKNTIAFIHKYLFNNNIDFTFENNNTFKFKIIENYDNYNNLNKNKYISIIKGLLEVNVNTNINNSYISFKIPNNKKLFYFIKNIFIKFGILISANFIENDKIPYYNVKIPKTGIVCDIFNISKNYDDFLNYFIYDNLIWTKIKTINKIDKYSGLIFSIELENNSCYCTESGIIS